MFAVLSRFGILGQFLGIMFGCSVQGKEREKNIIHSSKCGNKRRKHQEMVKRK